MNQTDFTTHNIIKWLFKEHHSTGFIPEWYISNLSGVMVRNNNRFTSLIMMNDELTVEIRPDVIFINEHRIESKEDFFNVYLMFDLNEYEYYTELKNYLSHYYGQTFRFKI
ncbi:hypothetical protein XaC1_206 [Xanthomonas phage XaC1]|nr:hypothetical protein XaC1_206 [Xanthomonas phage XaC1]